MSNTTNSIEKLTGTLVFVQTDSPKPCFDATKGTEYKASIVVSEDDADAWDAAYPKQSAKQIATTKFEDTYKIEPPFADQRKQYIITLRKNTKLSNGNPVPFQYLPKVFCKQGKEKVNISKLIQARSTEDGEIELQDNPNFKLVANGSLGQISVEHYDAKLGPVARLKNVMVTNLIEYIPKGQEDGGEFDDDDQPAEQPKVATKVSAPAKPAAKTAKKVVVDEEDLDAPF